MERSVQQDLGYIVICQQLQICIIAVNTTSIGIIAVKSTVIITENEDFKR